MKGVLDWKFDVKLFIYLVIGFIIATIIGTISHELGHWGAAKLLGYNAGINYGSMWLEESDKEMTRFNNNLIIMGGPLQTMITGTIGLLLLFRNRVSILSAEKLSFGRWIPVFLSLFWLRQLTNLITWLAGYVLNGQFSRGGDEIRLGRNFDFPGWIILSSTALIALIISLKVIFKYIPIQQRFTFILSGLVGGVLGYYFWLESFGEIIFP
jgi:hypothetical protein